MYRRNLTHSIRFFSDVLVMDFSLWLRSSLHSTGVLFIFVPDILHTLQNFCAQKMQILHAQKVKNFVPQNINERSLKIHILHSNTAMAL